MYTDYSFNTEDEPYLDSVSFNVIKFFAHNKIKYNPKSFTARYNLDKLVYFETFQMIGDAIGREKQLKAGNRAKKEALINKLNPDWNDLYERIDRYAE